MQKPTQLIAPQKNTQQNHLKGSARMLIIYHDDRALSSQYCLEHLDFDIPEISNEQLQLGYKQYQRMERDRLKNQDGNQELKKLSSSKVTDQTTRLLMVEDKNDNNKGQIQNQSQCSDFTFKGENIVTEKFEDANGKNPKKKTIACTLQEYYSIAKNDLTEIKTEKLVRPIRIRQEKQKLVETPSTK